MRGSNDLHLQFIRFLEEVREILNCRAGKVVSSGSNSPQPSDDEDMAKLNNTFASLDIEDSSNEFQSGHESQTAIVMPVGSKKNMAKAVPTYEQEVDQEKVRWAVYCFFMDFDDFRHHLRDVWS